MRSQAVFLLFFAVAAAQAQDTPTPAGDSIAAAKKDFAAIKSAAAPQDSSLVLPGIDIKDLGPSPGSTAPVSPALMPDAETSADAAKKKEKEGTGNWLVDAMDKKSSNAQSSRGRDDLLPGDQDFLRGADRPGTSDEKDAHEKTASKEPAEAVYNPLDAFMGGWISARDHELLLPAKGDALMGGDPGRARADALAGIDLVPSGSAGESLLPSLDTPSWEDSKTSPNPYIAALDIEPVSSIRSLAAPEFISFAPSGIAELPPGITSSGLAPEPINNDRSFIPDFAQPTDDDKYFKQMKRF